MLEALCIEACSILHLEKKYFFSAVVKASMKRHTKYWCKLSCEENGELLKSKCECPGGAGPNATCKHLAALAFLLAECASTGELMVKKSCTEILQTFHRPASKEKGKYS